MVRSPLMHDSCITATSMSFSKKKTNRLVETDFKSCRFICAIA